MIPTVFFYPLPRVDSWGALAGLLLGMVLVFWITRK